ncbi:hypothetical protein PGT21_000167 [Puccinia graminis f. sp. tritici]|uniref:Uncharacterized protein n=1 Tax=Puccinia graminis f. sp. tritici TaxID=56615 RepID=A0A5B0N6R5_PUCGR|nr:hypothetical protein PGT21_000167 [Puccinia graminis f. sp. tritici]
MAQRPAAPQKCVVCISNGPCGPGESTPAAKAQQISTPFLHESQTQPDPARPGPARPTARIDLELKTLSAQGFQLEANPSFRQEDEGGFDLELKELQLEVETSPYTGLDLELKLFQLEKDGSTSSWKSSARGLLRGQCRPRAERVSARGHCLLERRIDLELEELQLEVDLLSSRLNGGSPSLGLNKGPGEVEDLDSSRPHTSERLATAVRIDINPRLRLGSTWFLGLRESFRLCVGLDSVWRRFDRNKAISTVSFRVSTLRDSRARNAFDHFNLKQKRLAGCFGYRDNALLRLASGDRIGIFVGFFVGLHSLGSALVQQQDQGWVSV